MARAQRLLAIDQGTTGSTALVLSTELEVLARHNCEYEQIYPQPGWVEHNPEAILTSVRKALAAVSHALRDGEPAAIGITNQRETVVLWERGSGKTLGNALVWQDRRTAGECDRLRGQGLEPLITQRTGLLLDPYFSATKLRVLLDKYDPDRRRSEAGELAVGTIDTFVLWHLTGGAVHATDVSNASRTLLYNIHKNCWDNELLQLFGIPQGVLPEVRPSIGLFGRTRGFDPLPDGVPIAGIAGDQQAALYGQGCYGEGDAKCTFGTGAFLLMNTGTSPVTSHHRLLTTVAWQNGDAPVKYALEGSAFIAGAAVQWLRDGLRIIDSAPEVEALAASVKDSGGVLFVPALTGLGAPHWRPEATGLLHGITRGTGRGEIARAVLEGIAFQIVDLLRAMQKDSGTPLTVLRVDGGATANNLLMQIQTDLLQVPVERPKMLETTAQGAAMMAGRAVGLFADDQNLQQTWQLDRRFTPAISSRKAEEHYQRWQAAVAKA